MIDDVGYICEGCLESAERLALVRKHLERDLAKVRAALEILAS